MSRKFIARPIPTAGNTDPPEITQTFSFSKNTIIRAVRVFVLVYNDPAFTSISAKIYSVRGSGAVKDVAASTNSFTKAQVTTLAHAHKEIYFTFPSVSILADSDYKIGLIISGYTGTQSSHLAWAMSWPDPIYRTGLTINQAKAGVMPLSLSFIGSEF
jgi:hypothetical protein